MARILDLNSSRLILKAKPNNTTENENRLVPIAA